MPANVTPTSFSTSKVLNEAFDVPVTRFGEIAVTSTTAQAASVNQTGEAMFGGRPLIFTSKYAAPVGSLSTYPAIGQIPSYSVSRVVSSAPVALVTVSQNHQVVATNATVWNSVNSAQSLFTLANDAVSYKVSVVVDTVV